MSVKKPENEPKAGEQSRWPSNPVHRRRAEYLWILDLGDRQAELERQEFAAKLGLPAEASWKDIGDTEASRQKTVEKPARPAPHKRPTKAKAHSQGD